MSSIDDLRKPHPQQAEIDAASAALLRATRLERFYLGAAPHPDRRCYFHVVGTEEPDDFEAAQADVDDRDGWAADDCDYPD